MREIKFRCFWDGIMLYLNKSYDDFFFELNGGELALYGLKILTDESIYEKLPDAIFMQYTGLKDKNGIEIYEGDIIEFSSVSGIEDGIGFINWSHFNLTYICDYGDGNYDELCNFEYGDINIIGNIHDNPELLEER